MTIAIPTHNRAESFLAQALRSAAGQTYPRLEILVADNASSDGTEALVRGFTDAPIRYLRHHVNIGSTANYNSCLEQARGDYFLLLHDDDAIDSDFIATCIAAVRDRSDIVLVRTGIRIIDGAGQVLRQCVNPVSGLSLADFFCAWFEGKTYWYCANTLFKTAELRAAGGFTSPYSLAEDGFAIARWIQDTTDDVLRLEEGSLYPTLHRLEDKGWISSHWGQSANNRRARFYELTALGKKELASETRDWWRYAEAIAKVLKSASKPTPA